MEEVKKWTIYQIRMVGLPEHLGHLLFYEAEGILSSSAESDS